MGKLYIATVETNDSYKITVFGGTNQKEAHDIIEAVCHTHKIRKKNIQLQEITGTDDYWIRTIPLDIPVEPQEETLFLMTHKDGGFASVVVGKSKWDIFTNMIRNSDPETAKAVLDINLVPLKTTNNCHVLLEKKKVS